MKNAILLIITTFLFLRTEAQFVYEKFFFPVDTTHSTWNHETGEFTKYYTNGNIEIKGTLRYGVLHDTCWFYKDDGRLYQYGKYYFGKPIGNWTEFTNSGDTLGVMISWRPNEERKPSEERIESASKDEYILSFPNTWIIGARDYKGADFFIVPWDAFGSFSDNVTVVRNQITKDVKKHEDYVQMIKGLLESSFPNSEILSEETYELNGVKRTDVTMHVKVQNFDLIMKVNAFIRRNYGYQITLVCETSQFERRNVDFEVMINALELK